MDEPQIFRFELPNIQKNLKFRTPGYQFLTRPTTAILPNCGNCEPAVNRQPGYRRGDSPSSDTEKRKKKNSDVF